MIDSRVIHMMPGGRKVISVKVHGCDGFIASYLGPEQDIVFGHGMSRNEAVNEVTEKIMAKDGTTERR